MVHGELYVMSRDSRFEQAMVMFERADVPYVSSVFPKVIVRLVRSARRGRIVSTRGMFLKRLLSRRTSSHKEPT
jgi:hypothetical protein